MDFNAKKKKLTLQESCSTLPRERAAAGEYCLWSALSSLVGNVAVVARIVPTTSGYSATMEVHRWLIRMK